jgi:peptidoglycan/xylan/chitin deacetylase (PgdA/CDA1 family)
MADPGDGFQAKTELRVVAKPLAILMYHRISSERCPVPGDDREEMRYAVDLRTFERQVGAMKALGLRGVALGDALVVVAGRASDDSAVVITFDDGNRSDFEHALPVLRAAGYGATFFVSLNRVGRDDGLDESMIRALASDGFEVGSHGVSHQFLSTLDEREQTARSPKMRSRPSQVSRYGFSPPREGATTRRRRGFSTLRGTRPSARRVSATIAPAPMSLR